MLDDYSRYILAWTPGTTMKASDVTETLDLSRAKAGVDEVAVVHRPRLLSDHGPCYVSGDLTAHLRRHGMQHTRGAPYHPQTQGKIDRSLRRALQPPPLPRVTGQRDSSLCISQAAADDLDAPRTDKEKDNGSSQTAEPTRCIGEQTRRKCLL